MTQALYGVWTPWAQVLCYECHGNSFPHTFQNTKGQWVSEMRPKYNEEQWAEKLAPQPLESRNKVTYCDRCNRDIQVDKSTAEEHNMVKALRALNINAHMAQTGGMNSACEVIKKHDGTINQELYCLPYYYITYDFDGDGMYWLGGYDKEAEWIEGEDHQTETLEEMIKYIQALDNVGMQRMFKVTGPDEGDETVLMNEDAIQKQAAYYYNNSDGDLTLNLRDIDECVEFIKRVDTVEEVKSND